MDKIFASKPGRRRFLITIISILILLVIIRMVIFPVSLLGNLANETIISFLDKSVTSIFTAVIVGYFLYWVQSDEQKKSIQFTESGWEIEKNLNKGRLVTDFWYFNGGLGRYTRSDTLPKLHNIAINEAKTITVKLIVLNPFNDLLINNYIGFKNTVEFEQGKWTDLNIKSEIISTIVSAFYYKSQNTFLNIEIRLKDFFTLSRMDISSKLGVITREDPSIPSQILQEGSYLYKHYTEEFFQANRQSTLLSDYSFPASTNLEKIHVEKCIKSMFPFYEFKNDLVDMVFDKIKNPKHPF